MNAKNAVMLSDEDLRYAEELVEDGRFPSVSDVIKEGLSRLRADDQATDDPIAAMADEIRRRAQLPKDQLISMKDDNLFDRVRRRVADSHSK
ncbi:hypothetical protein [Rhizobium sp. AN80A]|uniref:hypothetical protein n=1 Tax=Rhizobium sp. AN80A TaxID=3040673 RepID=UPI0024B38E97|nr:hypothetical protein [Rhizobium sp. AN80A]